MSRWGRPRLLATVARCLAVTCYDHPMSVRALTVELEQEADGQWVAEVPELPGVLTPAA